MNTNFEMRVLRLMRKFGISKAQANAIAALVWGTT